MRSDPGNHAVPTHFSHQHSNRTIGSASALLYTLIAIAVIFGCTSTATVRVEQVTGEWEKHDDRLPPIHLRLWLERDTLRARLRLSGTESSGTAKLEGNLLRLDLSRGGEPMEGEFLSPTELELRFGLNPYRLRKKS